MTRTEKIISALRLRPHPEGGFYRETYRSAERLPQDALPLRYGGARCLGTAIYYLLTREHFSALHRLSSDEVLHFYCGDPVEALELYPDGTGEITLLGSDLERGMAPQRTVLRRTWLALRVREGGEYALLGSSVSPGFEFEDFEMGRREELRRGYPEFAQMIESLTK